jgi:uncharacterized membrane protein
MEDENDKLGSRFWLPLIGMIVLIGLIGIVLFVIFSHVWYKWGIFGALLAMFGGVLVFAWIVDRRDARKRANIEY